jgi:pyridoxal/pyridoxine/pyridoxamine kinase
VAYSASNWLGRIRSAKTLALPPTNTDANINIMSVLDPVMGDQGRLYVNDENQIRKGDDFLVCGDYVVVDI